MENTNIIEGGNKRNQVEKDRTVAKGAFGVLATAIVAVGTALIAKGTGKTIIKIGKLVLMKRL